MAGLFKYFERQSLPTSKETGLEEVVTKEANTAVEKALVEERKEKKRSKTQVHALHTRTKSKDC